ncbi:MAG: hypothetical protein KAH21_06140 [Spirochaetaceae bacterium]|nr:hypothetical protein [Spirochaetaceae bacterium]
MKENKVYSLNNFSDKAYQEFENGNVYIANLPVGNYIFGIVLLDDQGTSDVNDDVNVGLAIKEKEIKAGFNDIVIEVGPGINKFEINWISFEDFFTPDGYSSSFANDTIILDIDRTSSDRIEYVPTPAGATTSGIRLVDGVPTGASSGGSVWFAGIDHNGVEIKINNVPFMPPYDDEHILKIILK